MQRVDLRDRPEQEREAEARRISRAEAQQPFSLSQGPLARWTLLQLDTEHHWLLITLHHIVMDGWSMNVLMRELGQAYEQGSLEGLAPLSIQYADYACWQREWLQGERLERELGYWRQQLAGAPALLELPTDHPRPAVQGMQGAVWSTRIDGALSEQVRQLGREHGATLFMVLLASFQALLSRYSGQRDIVVGSPIAGRNRVELEGLIGFFVNTLALRTDLSDGPGFVELLERVKGTTLEAYAHQQVPFERLVEELAPERSLAHAPLVQVMFGVESGGGGATPHLADLKLELEGAETRTAKFDLTVSVEASGEQGMVWEFEYRTDLFEASTIERLARHWEVLLRAMVAEPERSVEELELLSEGEQRALLVEANQTEQEWPDAGLVMDMVQAAADGQAGSHRTGRSGRRGMELRAAGSGVEPAGAVVEEARGRAGDDRRSEAGEIGTAGDGAAGGAEGGRGVPAIGSGPTGAADRLHAGGRGSASGDHRGGDRRSSRRKYRSTAAPRTAGQSGVCDLHLGIHWEAQGRNGFACEPRQPDPLGGRAIPVGVRRSRASTKRLPALMRRCWSTWCRWR